LLPPHLRDQLARESALAHPGDPHARLDAAPQRGVGSRGRIRSF
jgi:hypothetical protein